MPRASSRSAAGYHHLGAVMRLLIGLACCSTLLCASTARAQLLSGTPPPELDLPEPLNWRWRRFGVADTAVTLTSGAVMLTAAIVPPRSRHQLEGGIGVDDEARRALRAPDVQTRYWFRDASDIGVSLSITWPFLADALTAAWWYRGSREVSEQMALINAQTFAIAGALQGLTNTLVSRQRPFGTACGSAELPSAALDCRDIVRYRSFFSGHATFAFSGAALICVHHFQQRLLGPPWDAVSCAGGYGVAAMTASFRVVSDMHYVSDVLMGSLVGTLVGYGVPLLHYGRPSRDPRGPSVWLAPAPAGLGVAGAF